MPGAVIEDVAEGLLEQYEVEGRVAEGVDRPLGERAGVGGVEQPVAVRTRDVVEDRGDLVVGLQRTDPVAAAEQRGARSRLDQGDRPARGQPGPAGLEHGRGPDDGERLLGADPVPPQQRERRAVVGMGVRHQHGVHPGQGDGAGHRRGEVEQEGVVDEDRRLPPELAAHAGVGARGARAPGVGPAVGGPRAEEGDLHQRGRAGIRRRRPGGRRASGSASGGSSSSG